MADGRKRQVSGHQRLAVRCQLPQKTDPDAGRLLGVVFEAVVPVGVLEPDLEYGVAGERQPVAAGRQADHAVPGGVAAGACHEHPRRHLVLLLERTAWPSAEARPGTLVAWRRGKNRATPRTWPRRPPGGPAGPDAADPSPLRRAARQRDPYASGSAPRRSRMRDRCRRPPVAESTARTAASLGTPSPSQRR